MFAVELQKVQQQYGKLTVLEDISWQLNKGEVLGLFGHNGAGKTTTVRLILGLIQASSGQVKVLGGSAKQPAIRQQIGFLPENIMFYPQLTGLETLQHFARLKNATGAQVQTLLEQVGLSAAAKQKVKTYSKGMRQRLGLAQALLGHPKLLILDEPTVGLDPIATTQLYQLINEVKDKGTSVIICSHVLPGVEPYIDKAIIMARGKIEALVNLYELREGAQLPVKMRVSGLVSPFTHEALIQSDTLVKGWQSFTLPATKKMAVLQALLTYNPKDIEIQPPSLEDLYCFYMHKAGAVGAAGVQL
jgi:Cu-processing system ATP-binding protein